MFLFKLLSWLPFWVLYFISDAISFLAFRIIGYRKKVVITNLRNSFPEKSEKELTKIAKDFYRNLSDIIVESIKVLSMSADDMKKRVHVTNPSLIEDYINKGLSVIGLASHQANWEWMLLGHSARVNYPMDAVYKPLHNKFSDHLMLQIRTRFGAYPVIDKQLLREVVKRKNMPRLICMVADQTAAPESRYWTTFLNQDTAFFTGCDRIAKTTGYPVIYALLNRQKRGYYQLTFEKIAEPPYQADSTIILDRYAAAVERSIRQYPSDWLWSHKRWKHNRPVDK